MIKNPGGKKMKIYSQRWGANGRLPVLPPGWKPPASQRRQSNWAVFALPRAIVGPWRAQKRANIMD
jgi:hypothetical protein